MKYIIKTYALEGDNPTCPCATQIYPKQNSQMAQHIKPSRHKLAVKNWKNNQKKLQLTAFKNDFNFEMTTWMVVNNIAISKLKKKSFVDFLKKYMMHPIPCHMTIKR